ncbi:hypothetical protein KHA90_18180 [Flavobacterium psychroterrae]|uniref:Lipoprotein n=1 Tax=Flavobacterium psychroterrae TaxID=2133767 RepID=A0ABS5PF91_9FLAO|nr:hypothetical protein [Flavobacterium psychroterrae]MBS7232952.1 hypothetical protein [Flavobacterium psychroterrae]
MGNIDLKKVGLIMLTVLFFCSCKEEKTEVFKMNVNSSRERSGELFIVSKPPEDFAYIIFFIKKRLKVFF